LVRNVLKVRSEDAVLGKKVPTVTVQNKKERGKKHFVDRTSAGGEYLGNYNSKQIPTTNLGEKERKRNCQGRGKKNFGTHLDRWR